MVQVERGTNDEVLGLPNIHPESWRKQVPGYKTRIIFGLRTPKFGDSKVMQYATHNLQIKRRLTTFERALFYQENNDVTILQKYYFTWKLHGKEFSFFAHLGEDLLLNTRGLQLKQQNGCWLRLELGCFPSNRGRVSLLNPPRPPGSGTSQV